MFPVLVSGINFQDSPDFFDWFDGCRKTTCEIFVEKEILPQFSKQENIIPRLGNYFYIHVFLPLLASLYSIFSPFARILNKKINVLHKDVDPIHEAKVKVRGPNVLVIWNLPICIIQKRMIKFV